MRSVAAMLKPNPAIMAVNPLSKIPTLVREDGLVLFDSVVGSLAAKGALTA